MKVGDRVIWVDPQPRSTAFKLKGKTGTLSFLKGFLIGVSWDDWQEGNNLLGTLKDNSGYFVFENEIELLPASVKFIKEL